MNRFEADLLARLRRRGDGVEGCRVLVACSGGGDSTALMVALCALRRSLGLDLVLAHADHGLREASTEDAAFVQALARHFELDLAEAWLDVRGHAAREGVGLETAARKLRWAWLKAEADSCSAAAIATGHTLDDHTETVFLRLGRGGGLGAVTPLSPRQAPRWSPLVHLRREALRDYLRNRKIPWREDASNAEPFTARNRLRPLLQELRAELPELDASLQETHAQVRELLEWREAAVLASRNEKWRPGEGNLYLAAGLWTEPELRAALEAGFRELGWAREAEALRGLSAFLLPELEPRIAGRRRDRACGHWRVSHEPTGLFLHPIEEPGAASR
jgi:tRNA(Ile)-lysidine synthetase-like protein